MHQCLGVGKGGGHSLLIPRPFDKFTPQSVFLNKKGTELCYNRGMSNSRCDFDCVTWAIHNSLLFFVSAVRVRVRVRVWHKDK